MAAVVAILDSLSAHLAILCLLGAPMHHQVSIQLDYRGDIHKYEFSTFFQYKCIWPIRMHGEGNLTLP